MVCTTFVWAPSRVEVNEKESFHRQVMVWLGTSHDW